LSLRISCADSDGWGQVSARGDAELVEDVAEMRFHGGLGDEQVLGDLAVGQALGG
jgi:hypothetical protein